MAVVQRDSVVIEKSLSDHRLYRSITLPNKLQAVLIQDVQTDKAAAALDVHIGSFSEPNDIPGLAHFREHMLFLCVSTSILAIPRRLSAILSLFSVLTWLVHLILQGNKEVSRRE